MTEAKIRELLNRGEDYTTEYKKCVNELSHSVFETVSSFSNRYGGYIFRGQRSFARFRKSGKKRV